MKPDIHPEYGEVKVTCSCGDTFIMHSTHAEKTLTVEVCSACHPFYTGKHKILESAGQVDKWQIAPALFRFIRACSQKPKTGTVSSACFLRIVRNRDHCGPRIRRRNLCARRLQARADCAVGTGLLRPRRRYLVA